jgi:hypothetical protein
MGRWVSQVWGQPYVPNHSTVHISQGFQNNNFRLDAMNNPRKSRSGDTVTGPPMLMLTELQKRRILTVREDS